MKKREKAAQTATKILLAATRIFGKYGYNEASLSEVAAEAGVSESILKQHFHSKERLIIEAQRSTFRELHRRFTERAVRGERGLSSAVDGLDSMWSSIRELREGAPFIVETLNLASQSGTIQKKLRSFYQESTDLLTDGIQLVFAESIDQLAIPPQRMATIIRILLEGLVVELAQAQSEEELQQIDQAYADMRGLFARFVIVQPEPTPIQDESFPLPW